MPERPGEQVGPGGHRRAFFLGDRRLRPSAVVPAALLILLVWGVGCAPPEPAPTPEPEPAPPREAVRSANRALERAESLYEAGEHSRAADLADSLHRAWRPERDFQSLANQALWLQARSLEADGALAAAGRAYEQLLSRLRDGPVRSSAVQRLAGIRYATGDSEDAARLLLEHPEVVEEEALALLRDVAPALADPELERLADRYPPDRPGAAPLHAERARRLLLAGQRREAERVARRLLAASPPAEERRVAEAVVAAAERRDVPIRIGAVLPLSGQFAGVGELLREGIELAIDEFRASPRSRASVELLLEDDGSDPERAVELVRRLEEAGAVAIVGPVRSEALGAAARGRRNPRMPLVSPTATEVTSPSPHAYTVWSRERRERDVARDVAVWAVERLGLRRAAILYPVSEVGRWAAEAFAEGVRATGGEVVRIGPYPAEATTFEEPISAVAEAEPDVVFVAAESVPSVLQLAPQLPYYGVSSSVVIGGPTWSDPAVVRRLESSVADFRLVATFVDRVSEGTGWERFRSAYETKHDKPLRDNLLPALSYDATWLLLDAASEVGLPLPGAVAEALAKLPERSAATGSLRPDPASSTVARRTVVRMILDRELVEARPERILEWLEEARLRAEEAAAAEEARP